MDKSSVSASDLTSCMSIYTIWGYTPENPNRFYIVFNSLSFSTDNFYIVHLYKISCSWFTVTKKKLHCH